MKSKLIRTSLLGLAAIGTLVLASCQAPSSAPTAAVSCDKCGTVHFKAPSTGYGPGSKGIVTLRDASRMSCPDCENQVIAMMKKYMEGDNLRPGTIQQYELVVGHLRRLFAPCLIAARRTRALARLLKDRGYEGRVCPARAEVIAVPALQVLSAAAVEP